MFVRALMACGPKCLRCWYEMPSGPVAEDDFVPRMAAAVMPGVNGGGMVRSGVSLCSL